MKSSIGLLLACQIFLIGAMDDFALYQHQLFDSKKIKWYHKICSDIDFRPDNESSYYADFIQLCYRKLNKTHINTAQELIPFICLEHQDDRKYLRALEASYYLLCKENENIINQLREIIPGFYEDAEWLSKKQKIKDDWHTSVYTETMKFIYDKNNPYKTDAQWETFITNYYCGDVIYTCRERECIAETILEDIYKLQKEINTFNTRSPEKFHFDHEDIKSLFNFSLGIMLLEFKRDTTRHYNGQAIRRLAKTYKGLPISESNDYLTRCSNIHKGKKPKYTRKTRIKSHNSPGQSSNYSPCAPASPINSPETDFAGNSEPMMNPAHQLTSPSQKEINSPHQNFSSEMTDENLLQSFYESCGGDDRHPFFPDNFVYGSFNNPICAVVEQFGTDHLGELDLRYLAVPNKKSYGNPGKEEVPEDGAEQFTNYWPPNLTEEQAKQLLESIRIGSESTNPYN